MENIALLVLAFAVPGFVICCILLKRNNKVYAYRMALLKIISQKSQEDIYANRDWRWRYDYFEAVSYTKQWLEWWRPLESFYNMESLLAEKPNAPS